MLVSSERKSTPSSRPTHGDKNLLSKNFYFHTGESPNELRIALIRAQGLAIADKNLLSKGGSSTPRCTFELTGVDDPLEIHTVKKCLDPKFHEQFVRLLDGARRRLVAVADRVRSRVFRGPRRRGHPAARTSWVNSLWTSGPLKDHKPVRKWYKLEEKRGSQRRRRRPRRALPPVGVQPGHGV